MAFYDEKYRIDSKTGNIEKGKLVWAKEWNRWDNKTHDTLEQAQRRLEFLRKHKATGVWKGLTTKFKIKKLKEVM